MFAYAMMSMLYAQEVQVSLESDKVIVGIPTILTVVATGFEESPTPEIGDFRIQGRNRDAVQLDFMGVDPMVSRQTSIVNGRRSDATFVRYAYRYRMVVEQEGNFQVPSIQVTQGSVSATSAPGTFRVTEAPTSSEMAIALELPEDSVWVGQTIPLNVDLFIQRDLADLNIVVPLFDLFPVQPAQADGVTQQHQMSTKNGVLTLPVVQDIIDKDGQGYTRIRMMAETTLNQSGKVTVPPARVLANMVVGQQRGFMGFSQNRYQLFQAKDQVRTLDVRPLPLKDRPDSFSGAVGESFSIQARANKTVVAVGEPIPIELEIRGKGSLDGLQLPDFMALGLDPKQVETPSQAPLGIINEDGAKVFSFAIRLKDPNVREIPVLDFAYFDPKEGRYQHAYTQPIALSVSGSNMVSSAQVVSSTTVEKTVATSDQTVQSLSTSQFDLSWNDDARGVSDRTLWLGTALVHLLAVFGWFWIGWRDRTKDLRDVKRVQKASVRELKSVLHRAQTEPAAQVSADLNRAMKGFGVEHDVEMSELISSVEIECYHPNAKSQPLSPDVLQRIQTLLPLVFCMLAVFSSRHAVAEEANFAEQYVMVQSIESAVEQRQEMLQLQRQLKNAVQENPNDPMLWSNLGTVSIQIPDRGQAVYAYQRAERLGLQTSQIRQNQQALQNALPPWAQDSDGSAQATDVVSRPVRWMAWNFLALMVGLLWRRNRLVARVAAVLWLVVMGMNVVEIISELTPTAIVMLDTPIRSADHPQSPLVQNEWLPSGATVQIQQVQSDWTQVQLNNGTTGWVSSNDLSPL
jgi:hypothetical protein